MRFNKPIVAALLAGLASIAAGQKSLPDNEVPDIGGGFFKGSDPAVANYKWDTVPPFTAADYGGYYTWAINNNTVSVNNATAQTSPLGITNYQGTNTKYPFFIVNEGSPKKISQNRIDSCQPQDEKHGKGHNERHGKFKKILHIIFENEYYGWTMNDSYWKLLATRGKLLTNSHGITHPSFPNYAALVAGDFFGINQENWYFINTTTIYDLLDAQGLDYATYAEWYTPAATKRGPNDCNNAVFMGPLSNTSPDWTGPIYRRLDVPALLFSTYTSNYTRCSRIYNATEKFDDDVKSHRLPPYSFYVPDMLHNGHDPESDSDYDHQPTTAGIWFNAFLDMYLPELTAQGTLVVATWDEATWQSDDDSVPNNNNSIATLLFGHGITPNTKDDTYITHYGLLRGAINNFGLGSLGRNDTNATNGDLSLLLN
ncbi:hypothetical protein FN846DRAFT_991457 [Sphaerosporella brunnea]|uniref:Phosphoesterase family-domain-containing protein n=1 Tax=Sphaerosporella brunnea TaxID=1250544 RepID=A0A5J5EPI9_9PEZI|nr:hypothetical protein FN846DRAFT_991457 [Sphaerosporella brunnea]